MHRMTMHRARYNSRIHRLKNCTCLAQYQISPTSGLLMIRRVRPFCRILTSLSEVKMATGMYPTGSSHPYSYPLGLNFTRWVTHTRTRVEKYFHTRTRWVICTRRVTHTRKDTRHSHEKLSHSKLHTHGYKSLIHHELKKDHTGYKFPNAINR